ncbi:DUF302 domain-containing protein [Curtobacterium sp. MCBA15_008]|jgi:uncharacterized protein (DUF302 family)|uniref:DUF302 domain-containing protein n=1 Tax=Curtobacterium sp. MCBA15_008 TaxID=1898736 RepID=UPI0008DDD5BC|nr:DUF302 domain-containing protein [Curtobacterium sp. MCBA15_008]OII09066.1 hypothetical protein BIU96_03985 [Curtobacterium sp. MCBA15_008]
MNLRTRHLQVFGVIDHAAAARTAGLTMLFETVIVFGNPAVGTALMLADPRIGYDLPMRMLVRALPTGGSEIVYRDPMTLASEYDLADVVPVLEKLSSLLLDIADGIR